MATRRRWEPLGAGIPAAPMLLPPSEQALTELLACKEEEWRALQAHRSQLQEAALQDAQGQLEEARRKLLRLQEDFLYNLQVLEERDRELERYDATFARAQRLDEARQAEVSELKVQAAKLKQALAVEAGRVEELHQQQQLMLQEHRLQLERVHSDKNGELDCLREQYENLKWKLERKLQELDGELALQRQELLQEFESTMQKREHEFRLQADHQSSLVLAHELKVKLLNKELESLKEAGVKAAESLQQAEKANLELVQKVQCRDQELQGLTALSSARHDELDHLAREKDAVLASMKDAHSKQLRALEARVRELQAHGEVLEAQLRGAERRQADTMQEKAAAVEKLNEDMSTLRSGWNAQMAQLSKEVVSKDLQVHELQEEEGKLKAQLARFQQDIERYKKQLSQAIEREQSLGREKVQLELDWQRRWNDVERSQYHKSETLIQGLTAAKDQMAARLEEMERTLRDREVLLRALTLERDQAMHSLRTHGLLPEKETQSLLRHHEEEISKGFPSSEIQQLQEQNTSLRNAIAQMRKEMEALSDPVLPSAPLGGDTPYTNQPGLNSATHTATPDYVLALEAEIRNLKHKFKTLEEQLEDVLDPPKMSLPSADTQTNTPPRAETTGLAVQDDRVATALAARKLGDRVTLLSVLVAQLRQKVLQVPLDMDIVHCQLPREVEQVHLEVSELRTQVAELEKHLGSIGKEGVEVSSRQQLRAPKAMALSREDRSDGEPVVQGDYSVLLRPGTQHPQGLPAHHLQRRLREAARMIFSLRQEKEQLLEMGNRLRAELGRTQGASGKPPAALSPGVAPSPGGAQSPGEAPGVPSEQLQPHFSTQDSKNAKKEHFSECLGKHQSHLAKAVSRVDIVSGSRAAVALAPLQCQHRVLTVTCRSMHQKENRSPKPPQAQESHEENSQQSSSLASSSLQDTWKLLELGSSPSGLTSQDNSVAGQRQHGPWPAPHTVSSQRPWIHPEPCKWHLRLGPSLPFTASPGTASQQISLPPLNTAAEPSFQTLRPSFYLKNNQTEKMSFHPVTQDLGWPSQRWGLGVGSEALAVLRRPRLPPVSHLCAGQVPPGRLPFPSLPCPAPSSAVPCTICGLGPSTLSQQPLLHRALTCCSFSPQDCVVRNSLASLK
ncbi:coiled-coil domain-containing protein 57 isoform X3 [Tamandua tetradactyla]|uniref:coiled-coil domain-containing protein 57 isoform X3 n=1 Tax=Tamandua tetradactyla TaxID=48850 RepID=UPI004053F403